MISYYETTETFMNAHKKILDRLLMLAAATVVAIVPITINAEDTPEYLTADEYIEQARPYLHLSCRSAWELVKEDADAYVGIIDKLAAVGFINHDLDVKKLGTLSEKELEAFRVEYYNSIGDQCRENPNNLLAGIVENALLDTFSKIQPDAEMK
jgi:hypothetical protein